MAGIDSEASVRFATALEEQMKVFSESERALEEEVLRESLDTRKFTWQSGAVEKETRSCPVAEYRRQRAIASEYRSDDLIVLDR